ncbi:MAG: TolB family protein [Nannocystales bacterium]
MTRTVSRHALLALALTVACGPAVTSSTGGSATGTGSSTSANDGSSSDDSSSEGGSGSTSGESDGDADPPAIRILYSAEAGLMARTAVGGVIGDPELIAMGAWTLVNSADEAVAVAQDGPVRLIGPWSPESLNPQAADCPETDTCSVFYAGGAWLAGEIRPEAMGSDFYVVVADEGAGVEPIMLYPAAQGTVRHVLDGGYLGVTEPRENPTQLLRVPIEPGGTPELLLELDPDDVVSGSQSFLFRARDEDESGWQQDMTMVDVLTEPPSASDVPLLQGAAGHNPYSLAVHPTGRGIAVVQGSEAADLAWIPYSQGGLGDIVQLSTGAAAGGVSTSSGFRITTFSPAGEWLTFSSQPAGEERAQLYLVSLSEDSAFEPIPLGEGGYGVEFTQDESFVYFVAADGESYSIERSPLDQGIAGPPELVFEGPQPRSLSISEDGSTLVTTSLDQSRLWVVDLAGVSPVTTEIDACGDANIYASLAPDGSVLSCSWQDEGLEDRGYALLGLTTGEQTMLDATGTPRLLTIVP